MFDPGVDADQWCARRLLVTASTHNNPANGFRQEIERGHRISDFMRFLPPLAGVAPGTQREGRAVSPPPIAQLQGFEIPAGVWEETVLPTPRVRHIAAHGSMSCAWSGRGRLGAAEGA